jgi:DNA polymerase-3 subunit beta
VKEVKEMKIMIKRDVFLDGLEETKDSVGKQTALPVLRNIKLTAKDGALKLFTTNLSTGTLVSLKDLSIFSEGEILCDASKLTTIIKELPEKEIRMETDENGHLILECEKSHFRLFTMSPDEFPSEPEIPEEKLVPIDHQFFESLGKAKYAASKDNGRYNLNCLYLDKEVVATDGHRMGVIRKNLGFDNILVPLDFVNLILKKNHKENGNSFQVGCFQNIMFIKSENLTRFGRLIDGEFPDYSQVIPNGAPRSATVDRLKLFQAIKRIMLMSGKNYQMRFEFWPHSLILSSFSQELGDASEEIEAEYNSEGPEKQGFFAIGFNGKYLQDMLEVLEGERVTMEMNNEVSPVKIDEGDSTHILMPLRLSDSEPRIESETDLEPEPESDSEFVEEAA